MDWPKKSVFENYPITYNQDWQNGKSVGFNKAIDQCTEAAVEMLEGLKGDKVNCACCEKWQTKIDQLLTKIRG